MGSSSNPAVQILREVENSKYNDVPIIVLQQTKLMLDRKQVEGTEIWSSGLMEKIVSVIGWDYLKVQGQWATAAEIVLLWNDILAAYPPPKYDVFLRDRLAVVEPKSYSRLLSEMIFQRLHGNKVHQPNILKSIRSVCNSILARVSSFPDLPNKLLEEDKLMESLELVDRFVSDPALHELYLSFFRSLAENLRRDSIDMKNLWRLHFNLLPHIQHSHSTKAIQLILAVYIATVRHTDAPYRRKFKKTIGESLLSFSQNESSHEGIKKLRRKLSSLQNEEPEPSSIRDLEKAVTKIQACWRGYHSRVRMAKAKSGFVQLQRLFRRRIRDKKLKIEKSQLEADRRITKTLKDSRESRRLGQLRFEGIAALPKGQLNNYLEEETRRAATVIQSYWRGCRGRKELAKSRLEERRAALRIQRFLWKCVNRKQRQLSSLKNWPLMSARQQEECEMELKRLSDIPADRNISWNLEELNSSLVATQQALFQHRKQRSQHLQDYQRRALLLAKLESDTYLLENAPKISKATEEEMARYHSFNAAVKSRANQLHKEQKRKLLELETFIHPEEFPVLNSL